jgi:hypothetical protein
VDAGNAVLQQVRHLESESIWYSRATRDQRHGPGACRPPLDECLFGLCACVESSQAGQLLKPIIIWALATACTLLSQSVR